MPTDFRTEDDLRAVLSHPAGVVAAEQRLLQAVRDGAIPPPRMRRPRARILTAAAAASVTVAAVAIVAVVLTRPGGGGRERNAGPTAPGASGSSDVATSTPPAPPVTVTPQVVASILRDLLQADGRVSGLGGAQPHYGTNGWVVLDDGSGAARVEVDLAYPYRDSAGLQSMPPGSLCQLPDDAQTTCVSLPDGDQLQTFTGPSEPGKPTMWAVTLLRTDGVKVDVSEWNSRTEAGSTVTRALPPLTIQRLTAVAKSPRWTAKVPATVAAAADSLFVPDVGELPGPTAVPTS